MTTKTIKTSGGDYTTIAGWAADLTDTGIYTDNIALGEIYSGSYAGTAYTMASNLTECVLSTVAADRHDGTAGGSGVTITSTLTCTGKGNTDTCRVQWLEIDGAQLVVQTINGTAMLGCIAHDRSTGDAGGSAYPLIRVNNGGGVDSANAIASQAFGMTQTGAGSRNAYGFALGSNGRQGHAYRCIADKIHLNHASNAMDPLCFTQSGSSSPTVENCYAVNATTNGSGTPTGFNVTGNSGTVTTSGSFDTTAEPAALDSLTPADEVENRTAGFEDYTPLNTGNIYDAGTDSGTSPAFVEIDATGRDSDAEGDTWSVGAIQYVSSGFTATADVTAGGATVSATATFAPDTSSATADVTAGGATAAAVCSFTPPVYTATTDVTAGGATVTATASYAASSVTATAAVTAAGATVTATATFAVGTVTATADVTAGGATAVAAATFDPGTFTGSIDVTAGGANLVAAATHVAPSFTATADVTAAGATVTAAATYVGGATAVAAATFDPGTFTGSIDVTAGGAELVAAATFVALFTLGSVEITAARAATVVATAALAATVVATAARVSSSTNTSQAAATVVATAARAATVTATVTGD